MEQCSSLRTVQLPDCCQLFLNGPGVAAAGEHRHRARIVLELDRHVEGTRGAAGLDHRNDGRADAHCVQHELYRARPTLHDELDNGHVDAGGEVHLQGRAQRQLVTPRSVRALGGALPAGVDSDKVRVVRVEGGAPLIVGERIDGVDSVDGLSGCSAAATKEPSALLDTPQSTHADARRVHLVIVKDGRSASPRLHQSRA